MRLRILSVSHMQRWQRFKLNMFGKVTGLIPPPFLSLSYKRELFGKYFSILIQDSMRRDSEWQVGELELFGAFVSKLNECQY